MIFLGLHCMTGSCSDWNWHGNRQFFVIRRNFLIGKIDDERVLGTLVLLFFGSKSPRVDLQKPYSRAAMRRGMDKTSTA